MELNSFARENFLIALVIIFPIFLPIEPHNFASGSITFPHLLEGHQDVLGKRRGASLPPLQTILRDGSGPL